MTKLSKSLRSAQENLGHMKSWGMISLGLCQHRSWFSSNSAFDTTQAQSLGSVGTNEKWPWRDFATHGPNSIRTIVAQTVSIFGSRGLDRQNLSHSRKNQDLCSSWVHLCPPRAGVPSSIGFLSRLPVESLSPIPSSYYDFPPEIFSVLPLDPESTFSSSRDSETPNEPLFPSPRYVFLDRRPALAWVKYLPHHLPWSRWYHMP